MTQVSRYGLGVDRTSPEKAFAIDKEDVPLSFR